jgi:hypothetical protein
MSEPLYQVKLLSALRTGTFFSLAIFFLFHIGRVGDPALIHPFLAGIVNDRRASRESESDLGAAALHLAIRCASGASSPPISHTLTHSYSPSRNRLASTLSQIHPSERHSSSSLGNDSTSSSCVSWSR